ncbi:MAG: 50S ribosomal protein L11 methyltransferase [Alphaproteobacteria bacterium]
MEFAISTEHLHPSTELALECLQFLHDRTSPAKTLEVGCGNGLLSIVSAQIWQADVLAVDISDAALQDAKANILAQNMQEKIKFHKSDRFSAPAIRQHAPYSLIIANMLDQWLVEMAVDMKKHLKPGGYVILSGMLGWLVADTKQSYTNLGFEIIKEFNIGQWHSCVLKSPLP